MQQPYICFSTDDNDTTAILVRRFFISLSFLSTTCLCRTRSFQPRRTTSLTSWWIQARRDPPILKPLGPNARAQTRISRMVPVLSPIYATPSIVNWTDRGRSILLFGRQGAWFRAEAWNVHRAREASEDERVWTSFLESIADSGRPPIFCLIVYA